MRRYWYLDSVADISKRFTLSESKVKTTLFRCRAGLREHLEKEGYTVNEYENGEVEYDDLEDPLPFDMEADVIEIDDDDYALWYRDISEDMKKYSGKTVEFTGIAVYNNRVAPGTFAFGRQVMTCCEADIQYCSLLAQCPPKDMPINNGWYKMRLKVEIKFHKMYGEKGPILNVISMENCPAPEQPVATFF